MDLAGIIFFLIRPKNVLRLCFRLIKYLTESLAPEI